MPARRRNLRRKTVPKKGSRKKYLYFLLFVIFILFTFPFLSKRYWNGKDKLILVINKNDEEVIVGSFDPINEEIISISIPSKTEVEVSKNLGIWKLGSVWKLGYQEGLKGKLLAKTVTKDLKFPVYLWADGKSYGFISGSISELLSSVFSIYDTNLNFADRLGLGLFSLKVDAPKRLEVKLEESGYLKSAALSDGSRGYLIQGSAPPARLSLVFGDIEISEKVFKVGINDFTQEVGLVEEFSKVIESLGAKVSSIKKGEEKDINCEVKAKDERISNLISNLFDCSEKDASDLESFDIEISLGKKFIENF